VSMLVEDMSRNVLARFEYHMFYVLYPSVTYLLTLPRKLFYIAASQCTATDLGALTRSDGTRGCDERERGVWTDGHRCRVPDPTVGCINMGSTVHVVLSSLNIYTFHRQRNNCSLTCFDPNGSSSGVASFIYSVIEL
jgi:hypothetical protein